MSMEIPKKVVDRIMKRLDRRLNNFKYVLDNNNIIALTGKQTIYSPFTVDIFHIDNVLINRSSKPRIFSQQYINVFIKAEGFKHFSAVFFKNNILEYTIQKRTVYEKSIKLDALKIMGENDYWIHDGEPQPVDSQNNYDEYIEDSLKALITNRVYYKNLKTSTSKESNIDTVILDMLNTESGVSYIENINKYFSIDLTVDN